MTNSFLRAICFLCTISPSCSCPCLFIKSVDVKRRNIAVYIIFNFIFQDILLVSFYYATEFVHDAGISDGQHVVVGKLIDIL